eukprot:TRINITY_DN8006_c0_g1_i1.p1 TRINITY_DN8006_c0_g1~~TRINITY_DN8006_c0_g1_i1.p1  ORF type:complete len:299 (-),score=56.45 TRINITY_DN8006_c0_g1_i1:100-996(-)
MAVRRAMWRGVGVAVGAGVAWELYRQATPRNLQGEVVVITGGGSGIGRLTGQRMAALGCRVAVWDLNAAAAKETADLITVAGGEARAYAADVSRAPAVQTAAAQTVGDFGRVDILINNAGIVSGKKLLDVPDGLAAKTMDVNTTAHFWTVKSFLPGMLDRNHGHIVTIASAAGLVGVAGLADYCASKFGAVGFNESIRFELRKLGKQGVATSCICPFYINTGMFQGVQTRFPLLLPILEPDYVVDKIVQAVQQRREMVFLPRILRLTALGRFLPVPVNDALLEFLGVSNTMDEFTGRA